MPKRKSTAIGIAAAGKITAKKANSRVRSTDTDLAIGTMSGTGTEFEHENVEAAVYSTSQADDNIRSASACPPLSSSSVPESPAGPVAANTAAPVSIESMMAATKNMADGAYGTVAYSHHVSGKSTTRVEYADGAKGKAVATLAVISNVKDEDKKAVVLKEGRVTYDDRKAYTDSWRRILHDYTDENCYDLNGNCYGLIISNTFDKKRSNEKFGQRYSELLRHGGREDREQVKELFHHLNIKVIGDHENIPSEDLSDYLQEFKENVIQNKGAMFFVVVMSHGGLKRPDTVLMDDLEEVCAWKDIIYPLGDNDELREIPKIFLFNMCRDSWEPWIPKTVEAVSTTKVKPDSGEARCERSLRDALLLFSTIPYEVSRRDSYTGSVYISELYNIFMESAHKKTLWKMLYDVHMAVLEKHRQTPEHKPLLFKNLKFMRRRK